jgi:hypothetical protein
MQEGRTIQGARPNPNTGHHNTPPVIQHGHHANRKGTPILNKGDTTRNGRATITTPAPSTLCHPTSPCPPPFTMAAPSTTMRGEQTKDTRHTNTTDTHTTHTPHTRQRIVHDTTTAPTNTALGRVGQGPDYTHWTDQQHTPPPFHTPHTRGWTPSTHPLSHYSHSHNQRTITINNDQRSMFDQQSTNNEQ